MVSKIIRMGKKGVVVIPKEIRDSLGLKEGSTLEVRVSENSIVITPKDLWAEIAKRGVKISAEEAERELDEDEEAWLKRL